jgi:tetratricopeptide (TPR) repeat protein
MITNTQDKLSSLEDFKKMLKEELNTLSVDPRISIHCFWGKGSNMSDHQELEYLEKCTAEVANIHLSNILTLKGIEFQRQGRPVQSIQCYTNAIGLNSSNAVALYYMGIVLQTQNKSEEALDYYDRAIVIDPKVVIHCRVDDVLTMTETERRLTCCDIALSINRYDSVAYYKKGNLLLSLERYREYEEFVEYIRRTSNIHLIKCPNVKDIIPRDNSYFDKYMNILPNDIMSSFMKASFVKSIINECEKPVKRDSHDSQDKPFAKSILVAETNTNDCTEIDSTEKNLSISDQPGDPMKESIRITNDLYNTIKKDPKAVNTESVLLGLNNFVNESIAKCEEKIINNESINCQDMKGYSFVVKMLKKMGKNIVDLQENLQFKKNDYKKIYLSKLNNYDIAMQLNMKNYYKGFRYIYESTFTVATAISSGSFRIETGAPLQIISQILGLIPYVGTQLNYFTNLAQFFIRKDIYNRARRFLFKYKSDIEEIVSTTLYNMTDQTAKQMCYINNPHSRTKAKLKGLKKIIKNVNAFIYGTISKNPYFELGAEDAQIVIDSIISKNTNVLEPQAYDVDAKEADQSEIEMQINELSDVLAEVYRERKERAENQKTKSEQYKKNKKYLCKCLVF